MVKEIEAQEEREKYIKAWNETMLRIWQERQEFLEYGLWQDYGVGRETPRGNSGDIGRAKVRQRRPWFSKRYYASVLNLRDFFGENLGREFQGIMADTFERLNKLY